jgi:hypothetical protein
MGSVHPRNYNLIEKINKKPIICWVCNWLCLLLDTKRKREGRKVKSTAALANGHSREKK